MQSCCEIFEETYVRVIRVLIRYISSALFVLSVELSPGLLTLHWIAHLQITSL